MEAVGGIAPYRIDAEIAHSSLCTIYRAYEGSLDRPVLIKKLHPQMAREEDIRRRFEREAQVCARVKHENIVDIYSYRADPEVTMLVMEFVEGESLGELLRRQGRLDWKEVLPMLAGTLKGIGHAHSKGVTHRDIKPDNLLVTKDGRLKITDFGLATIADAVSMTMQGAVVGTPAYLPPEQVSGGKFDFRSDLFSVGVTFYEAVTGASPFGGQSFSETLKKILTYDPPDPSSMIPDVPQEFDQILEHLLEKQPSKRYASADLALEDVKRLAAMKGVNLETSGVNVAPDGSGNNGSVPKSSVILPPDETSFAKRAVPIWAFGLTAFAVLVMLFLVPGRKELIKDGFPKLNPALLKAPVFKHPLDTNMAITTAPPLADQKAPPVVGPARSGREIARHDTLAIPFRGDNFTGANQSDSLSRLPGQLTLTSRPWATVTIDNVTYGQTPLSRQIELSPGRHFVVLSNPEFPASIVESIEIQPGKAMTLDVNLWEKVGVFQIRSVRPWAEIFVDGVSFGLTPRAKPIILPFGIHELELRNPDFKVWSVKNTFSAEKRELEINVQLEPLQP